MERKELIFCLVTTIVMLVVGCIILQYRLNQAEKQHKQEVYENTIAFNTVIQEARRNDSIATRAKDSLHFLLSAKYQTIIINRFYNDSTNKAIASLNDRSTDTLYHKNLQSAYKKYGHLLTTIK